MTLQPCPRCGAPLADDGQCPRCLLRLGLELPPRAAAGEGGPATTPHAASRRPEPLPLDEVARRFPQLEIKELIGQGGMGVVYRARQARLGRDVALKLLPPEQSSDPAFAERFLREARAMARLAHPNIVAVHDFGESDGLCWLLMDFVDGVNLRQALRAGSLTPQKALAIVPQMCDALQYAHDEGVVHRDIKPENVLLDRQGRVRIADFGLAKLVGPQDVTLTGDAQVFGTPHYMAPEQLEGARDVDHRADIYSLGVVFYEMLTGRLPLGRFEPPSRRVSIDVRLDDVVLHALEQQPERRYQHAAEVKTDVESVARGGEPLARFDLGGATAGALSGMRADAGAEGDGGSRVALRPVLAGALLLGSVGVLLVAVWRRLGAREETGSIWLGLAAAVAIAGGWWAGRALARRHPRRAPTGGDAVAVAAGESAAGPSRLAVGVACMALLGGLCVADWSIAGGLSSLRNLAPEARVGLALDVGLGLLPGIALLAIGALALKGRAGGLGEASCRWPDLLAGALGFAALFCFLEASAGSGDGLTDDRLLVTGALLGVQAGVLGSLRMSLRARRAREPARSDPSVSVHTGPGEFVAQVDVVRALPGWLKRLGESRLWAVWVLVAMLIWFACAWIWAGRLAPRGAGGLVAGALLLGCSAWWWLRILVRCAPELERALASESPGTRALRQLAAALLLLGGLAAVGLVLLERWEHGTFMYVSPSRSQAEFADPDLARLAQALGELTAFADAPPAHVVRLGGALTRFARPALDVPGAVAVLALALLAGAYAVAAFRPQFARRWKAGWAPVVLGPTFLLAGLGVAALYVDVSHEAEWFPPLEEVSGVERMSLAPDLAQGELRRSLEQQGYLVWLAQQADLLPAPGAAPLAHEWLLFAEPTDPLQRWELAGVGPRRTRPHLVLRVLGDPAGGECVVAWDAGRVREWGAETDTWRSFVDHILEPLRRLQAPADGG